MKEGLLEVLFGLGLLIAVFIGLAIIGAVVISIICLFEKGSYRKNFRERYSNFIQKAVDWVG